VFWWWQTDAERWKGGCNRGARTCSTQKLGGPWL